MRVDEISLSGPLTVILSVTPCVRQENGASQYCLWLARSRTLSRGNGSAGRTASLGIAAVAL